MELTVTNLGKQYRRDVWGLKDFSLEIKPGILGLLGPNGAGKSTFMRMLATITKPTEGTVLWDDVDIVKSPDTMRAVLGYLPQDFGVYPNLNAIEFLEYMAAIKGLDANASKKRIDELLQVVNLVEAAKRPLGGYSGGMKQRVGIAQALLNDPQLLIVDEPTVGLDPEERVRFQESVIRFIWRKNRYSVHAHRFGCRSNRHTHRAYQQRPTSARVCAGRFAQGDRRQGLGMDGHQR